VGAGTARRVDVRVIAATNQDLYRLAAQGTFRADLHFRLNGAPRYVPPLRDRLEDIDALVALWLPQIGAKAGRPNTRLTAGALTALRRYAWPGNVRELRHVVEYVVSLTDDDEVTEEVVSTVLSRGLSVPDNASTRALSWRRRSAHSLRWKRATGIGRPPPGDSGLTARRYGDDSGVWASVASGTATNAESNACPRSWHAPQFGAPQFGAGRLGGGRTHPAGSLRSRLSTRKRARTGYRLLF